MREHLSFEALYEQHFEKPSLAYRAMLDLPVNMDTEAFFQFLSRMNHFREDHPNMAFWQVIDYKNLTILRSDGHKDLFGQDLTTIKEYFRRFHPDYLLPFLRWREASVKVSMKLAVTANPMRMTLRTHLPLLLQNGEYHWFAINKTILQVDAEGRMVTNLHTFYREGKWSPLNLRPFDFRFQTRGSADEQIDNDVTMEHALMIIDEFTDAELTLLSLYAEGKTTDKALEEKKWSRNTLHEYNSNILRKAKGLFVYDFKNARTFAEYCLEKGFLRLKG